MQRRKLANDAILERLLWIEAALSHCFDLGQMEKGY